MTELSDRLARVIRLADLEPLARSIIDPPSFAYIASGAWDEITLEENETAWRRRRFRPRMLVDVARVDPSTTMLGAASVLPVAVAPMACHVLAHPNAEIETATGAAAAGIPFILSTTSTRSIEEVAAGAPGGTKWFQLYTQAEPARTRSLVERAEAAGFTAIVVTVDLPVLGYRDRDRLSGFVMPPLGNFVDDMPGPAAGAAAGFGLSQRPQDRIIEGSLTWADLATIRSWTSLPLVLKGIVTTEDALLAVEHGVDALVVSNHGARQLDRVLSTADALPEVVAAVAGRTEIWVDGGIRRGLDIAIAIALGAQGVLVGRPMFWALAAGGAVGIERAVAILHEEFSLALALLGAPTPADIRPEHLAG